MSEMTQGDVPAWTLRWRLQRALAHGGVSIDEMAAELGVSRQTVSRWLNEHGSPKRGYLKLWALRCGVPLGWLTGADDGPKSGNRSFRTSRFDATGRRLLRVAA